MASLRRWLVTDGRYKRLIMAFLVSVSMYSVLKLMFPGTYIRLVGGVDSRDVTTLSPNYWMEYRELESFNYSFVYEQ